MGLVTQKNNLGPLTPNSYDVWDLCHAPKICREHFPRIIPSYYLLTDQPRSPLSVPILDSRNTQFAAQLMIVTSQPRRYSKNRIETYSAQDHTIALVRWVDSWHTYNAFLICPLAWPNSQRVADHTAGSESLASLFTHTVIQYVLIFRKIKERFISLYRNQYLNRILI